LEFTLKAAAGESESFLLHRLQDEHEMLLNVKVVAKTEQDSSPAVVAEEQFVLPGRTRRPTAAAAVYRAAGAERALKLFKGFGTVSAQGADFLVRFNRRTGYINRYEYRGGNVIGRPLRFEFWRAPTGNDIGWKMPVVCGTWRDAGALASGRIAGADMDGAEAVITAVNTVHTEPSFEIRTVYRINAGGTVYLYYEMEVPKALPLLPKVGMQFELDKAFDTVRYFGRGPQENYTDRSESAFLGAYPARVDDYTPYSRPQENNNRTGVSKLTLSGDSVLTLYGNPDFEAGWERYFPQELTGVRYRHLLPAVTKTVLQVNLRQMGVGGDDSWGAMPHEEYLLRPGRFAGGFAFQAGEPDQC
jgi:beta-galactosidase